MTTVWIETDEEMAAVIADAKARGLVRIGDNFVLQEQIDEFAAQTPEDMRQLHQAVMAFCKDNPDIGARWSIDRWLASEPAPPQ